MRPIHTVNTTVGFEGWIRINFTSVLADWIVEMRLNNLLQISIEYENEYGQRDIPSVDLNYLLSYWDSDRQPFITAYFKNEDSEGHMLSSNHQVKSNNCNEPNQFKSKLYGFYFAFSIIVRSAVHAL